MGRKAENKGTRCDDEIKGTIASEVWEKMGRMKQI